MIKLIFFCLFYQSPRVKPSEDHDDVVVEKLAEGVAKMIVANTQNPSPPVEGKSEASANDVSEGSVIKAETVAAINLVLRLRYTYSSLFTNTSSVVEWLESLTSNPVTSLTWL